MKVVKELLGGVAMTVVCILTVIFLIWCSGHTTYAETWEEIGTMRITHYCPCEKCCHEWAYGPTASGVMPTRFRTVAVDKDQIPLGSTVYIEGYGFRVAEDTGVGWGCIDVYTDDHQRAKELGLKYRRVWIVKE